MSEQDALSNELRDSLAYSYGVDTPAKAKMVEAFINNPKARPFSRFASIRVDHGSFADVYRHIMYPKSIIRLSTPWTGDPYVDPVVKHKPQGHSHYMEEWMIPNQGNPYTPKVDMYVRLNTGETLAIMEHLIPPDGGNESFMQRHLDEFKIIKGMNRVKVRPKGYSRLDADLQALVKFLMSTPSDYQVDFAFKSKNILMRDCGQMVITDPLS